MWILNIEALCCVTDFLSVRPQFLILCAAIGDGQHHSLAIAVNVGSIDNLVISLNQVCLDFGRWHYWNDRLVHLPIPKLLRDHFFQVDLGSMVGDLFARRDRERQADGEEHGDSDGEVAWGHGERGAGSGWSGRIKLVLLSQDEYPAVLPSGKILCHQTSAALCSCLNANNVMHQQNQAL